MKKPLVSQIKYPGASSGGASKKWIGLLGGAACWIIAILIGWFVIWKSIASPVISKIGDGGFVFMNKNGFTLVPNEWRSVPTHPGEHLSIKAQDPNQSKLLFARVRKADRTWTAVMPLDRLMSTPIDVGTGQSYVEVGMGTSNEEEAQKSVRVFVNYY